MAFFGTHHAMHRKAIVISIPSTEQSHQWPSPRSRSKPVGIAPVPQGASDIAKPEDPDTIIALEVSLPARRVG